MRKFIVVLMLAVSFTLGIFSQNLIAESWTCPSKGSNTFSLSPYDSKFTNSNGRVAYLIPHPWKVKLATIHSSGGRSVVLYFGKN